jgi:hypothetical protein
VEAINPINPAMSAIFMNAAASDFQFQIETFADSTRNCDYFGLYSDGMKEIVVRSLGELIDKTTPDEPDSVSGRLRDNSVYRGINDTREKLLTSLDRLGGENPAHSKAHLEEHLLRNFLRYGRQLLTETKDNLWDVMVVAEHHGLPTRLLDWTHSPLIAAHFATLIDNPGVNRVVWKLNWRRVHERFKLAPMAFLVEDLDELLRERGMKSGWDFLEQEVSGGQVFVCLLDPTAVTQRVEVQSGSFTLCSAKDKSLEVVLEEAGVCDALTRFIIPADKAGFIRDQLDLCTIDERRLFPGLDGVAAELKRYYSSSGERIWRGSDKKRRFLDRNPRPPSP